MDKDKLIDMLSELSTEDLFYAYCEYARTKEVPYAYYMTDFDSTMSKYTPTEIVSRLDKNFSIYDECFWKNGYNIESGSCNDFLDVNLDLEELANYIMENPSDFAYIFCGELRKYLIKCIDK